ncbi:MAG: alpha/beta hydrolase [Solirubrobacterales bacterium]|nr:alpha/beta hydrolase [Solirubrobacterales bacterium]
MTSSATCPPTIAPAHGGLLGVWLEGWSAAIEGGAEVFDAAMAQFPRPLDVQRWLSVTGDRRPPRWATKHELVFQTPVARLRDYSLSGGPRGLVPTLVLPPQAGHDSCIVDFSPEQSQMGAIREAGLTRAFTLDWVGATRETANVTIDDYLDVIDRAIEHCGGRVNLIGDCQGGWLAAIYAAQAPERINTLSIAGAPIDFTVGQPVIGDMLNCISPGGDLAFYESLVRSAGGVLEGKHMLSGFIAIGPGAEVHRQLDLLAHIDDPEHVDRYRIFEDWFKHTQDIPGGFYLWVVRHLFMGNELVRGELEVRGRHIDLAKLDMPLNLLAGRSDHITPPDQVFALADYASTPSREIVRRISPGGHLGLFMGHDALTNHWPPLLRGVLRHSKPRPRPRSRAAAKSAG